MILAAILVLVIGQCRPAQQTQLIGRPGNGELFPFDFKIGGGFAFFDSGQPSTYQAFFRQSNNLYDFVKHLEARKVVGDVCYIRKFKGSLRMAARLLSGAVLGYPRVTTQVSEDWDIRGKEIKSADLKKTVGAKIAEFCRGYRVFWVTKRKKVTRRDVTVMTKRQLNFGYKNRNRNRNGFSLNGGATYSKPTGFNGHLGASYRKGPLSLNAGVSHSRHGGTTPSLSFGYKKGDLSFQGGLEHNTYSGTRATIGLKLKF